MGTSTRRARGLVATLLAAAALGTLIGPVAAAATQPVTIVSHMTFNQNAPNTGDFVAQGGGGLICANGDVVDTRYVVGGGQSQRKLQILVLKDFICPDGTLT